MSTPAAGELDRPARPETTVHSLPPPPLWRRLTRQLRAYPLVDPLGQAGISLTLSIALGGVGAWMLERSRTTGMVLLLLAGVLALFYLALVGRAVKRDKAINYWRDRRDLRLRLTEERAQHAFAVAMLEQVHFLDGELGDDDSLTEAVLSGLASRLYTALAPRHDDLAVVLALAAEGQYHILHSALSSGSRWRALKPDKHCEIRGPLSDRLSELADHHHAAESAVDAGRLCAIVLADTELDAADRKLVDRVSLCLDMVMARRRLPGRRLRAVHE